MKLKYTTRVYEGPKTRKGIIELGKALNETDWKAKIYDPEKITPTWGEQIGDISGEIWGLGMTIKKIKYYSNLIGKIKPGRIEITDYGNNQPGLEKFLENYKFNELKGGNEND
jgi:hypothetical protein